MKKIIQLFLLMVPLGVCAQQGMNQADMEQMLQQAEKMESCMANIDQAALTLLSEKSQMMEQEVRGLCQTNKRDEAQTRAIELGREIAANDEMKKMSHCAEMMKDMVPMMGIPTVEEMRERHVCDAY